MHNIYLSLNLTANTTTVKMRSMPNCSHTIAHKTHGTTNADNKKNLGRNDLMNSVSA